VDQPRIAYAEIDGRSIAYRLRKGNAPALVFLPGFASNMEGAKAVAIDAFAEGRGLSLLRLDYSGTGSSSGRFEDATLALWLEESLAAVDRLTKGPLILIGSSMGGWIALHLALLRPERVQALVGIAAAPDFTDWGFGAEQRAMLAEKGRLGEPSPDGKATPHQLTRAFWESGQRLGLLDNEIAIGCPVRLVHGEIDRDVPLDVAFRLTRQLRSSDVQLNVIKGGGHRLSEPHEIDAILRTVADLLETVP
jgi:pimeloyl-ACP methyl ester carboxylesterase